MSTTSELSDDAKDFMATFFAIGRTSTIRSHPPHETLAKRRAAYDECRVRGLVEETPFNSFGVLEIRATEAGFQVAQERFRQRVLSSDLVSGARPLQP